MAQATKQAIALCQETDHHQILRIANYHLGCVHYQQNDLPTAVDLFTSLTAHPYQNYGAEYTSSVCGLGLTYQAQGKETEARQLIEDAIAFLLETGNLTQLPMVQALQAEIALRQGNLSAASQWADKLDPMPPFSPIWEFLAPHLTLIKVWLAQNTPASYEKAGQLLASLSEYLTETHNTRFLIDTLALQALLADVNGDQAAAVNWLEKSLRLAQPGGFIRVFVDLGPQMAALLSRMKIDPRLSAYLAQIVSAFPAQQQPIGAQIVNRPSANRNLAEPLTNRELQVLKLLREHLTNKEIAAHLVISPGTVKSHTIRIYQKLEVKGRQQAVEKALTLGILAPR
jgi:LuxR family maltose regulon positive regulatory protein